MIPTYSGKQAREWVKQRSDSLRDERIESIVKDIITNVRQHGDRAIAEIATRLKDPAPRRLPSSSREAEEMCRQLSGEAKQTIDFAAERIAAFAKQVMLSIRPAELDWSEYRTGLRFTPVERAACYVPAGRYPLPSTALMTAITAREAGVNEIAIFTPDLKPEIVYAGRVAGVKDFFEIGGAQAIAAAAFGTETISRVNVVVGPGNAYVVEAKRQLQGHIGIDMLAGPSEIGIIADGGANPEWVALDLLSQAEHDPDARSYLLTWRPEVAAATERALPELIARLNLPEFVQESLGKSAILILDDLADCIRASDEIAPEHLLLHIEKPDAAVASLRNFGALFIGYNATVPYGDYCAGPNHTLPTARAAKFAGGLNPLTFLRAQSWLRIDQPAPTLAQRTAAFADIEGLKAHSAAAIARLGTRLPR